MITKELIDFIKTEQSKGVLESDIRFLLIKNGWSASDVDEAYRTMNPVAVPATPAAPSASPTIPTINPLPEVRKVENTPVSHKRRKAFLFISIFIILLLIGGGVYAYTSGYFTSLSQVTSRAFDSMVNADSFSFDITLSHDSKVINNDENEPTPEAGIANLFAGKTSITTRGSFDKSDLENILLENKISLSHKTFSAEVEMRLVENVLYANLVKAPVIEFLPLISEYSNKWFSFPLKNKETGGDFLPSSFLGFGLDSIEGISQEEKEHIYQLTRNASFIKVKEKLAPETIGDTLSYHFTFDLNREGIASYLDQLRDYVQEVGKNDSRLSSFDPTTLNEALDKIENFQGEVWIGRKDNLLRKVDITFSNSNEYSSHTSIENNFSIIGIYDNWGEAVSVSPPEGSVDFKTFLEQGPLGEAQKKGQDAAIKSRVASLRAQNEIFYDSRNSYAGVCSSTETKEVESILTNEFEAPFQCFDSKNMYVAAVRLPSFETYCIDSTGYAGVVPESSEMKTKLTCQP